MRKGIAVSLTAYEMLQAGTVGLHRQIAALKSGLPDKHGYEGDGWSIHIEGALGEIALAKALKTYWSGSINTFKVGGDVGKLQVRTRSKDHYDLIVRDSDRDEDVFVLVIGQAPAYRVVGWITGGDAKDMAWAKEYGGRPAAYFVPQSALRSLDELEL